MEHHEKRLRMNPVLILAPNRASDGFGFNPEKAAKRMKRLHKILSKKGHTVKFLAAAEGNYRGAECFKRWGECLEEQLPDSVIRLNLENDVDRGDIAFPRDLFQTLGTRVIFSDCDSLKEKIAFKTLERLGIEILSYERGHKLGEGGLFVKAGNLIIASSRLQRWGLLMCQASDFCRYYGYDMVFLPSPFAAPLNTKRESKNGMGGQHHIDLDLNIVSAPDSTELILVNEVYYGVFKREVDALMKILREVMGKQAILHVIPKEEQRRRVVSLRFRIHM